MPKPMVRRQGMKLVVQPLTISQLAQLYQGLRMLYGGRIKISTNSDGTHEICFASTISTIKKIQAKKANPHLIGFADFQEEYMKQVTAAAVLLLQLPFQRG